MTTSSSTRPRAVIFDFDDTLCTTGPLWAGAIRAVCREGEIPFASLGDRWRGRSPEGVSSLLAAEKSGAGPRWSEAMIERRLRES
ncbi:MAG: hypothetical protein JJU33_10215, partial [Phycisphaerales bacterium]|nr:hypothetical protein [Phycisphaerales bacterium]